MRHSPRIEEDAMTSQAPVQQSHADLFGERLEIVLSELELAIKWDRSSVFMVVTNSEYTRADAETALRNSLIERGQKITRIQLNDEMDGFIPLLRKLQDPEQQIYFIHGCGPEQRKTLAMIGNHKDIFIRKKVRAIIWVNQSVLTDLVRNAHDLWEFTRHIVEFPDNPRAENALQDAVESAWMEAAEHPETEEAEEELSLQESMLTELSPKAETTIKRAKLLLTLGILNWRKNNHETAEEFLQDALKAAIHLEDNWFEAECFNALALVKFAQNKNDEAIEAYKRAIEAAPEQISVWNNLGNLCLKIGRNDEAMLAFQKTLKHTPNDPVAWSGLGSVYYRIGYIEDSITAYRKAIECAPLLAQPWSGLGESYVAAGRDPQAITAYQKAIELNKNNVASWLSLADIYRRQGRTRDAVKTYQRALAVSPKNQQLWNELGLSLLKINSHGEAASAFLKAIDIDPSFGSALNNLALAYSQQGKYSQAIEACRKSLQVFTQDSERIEAWDRLANIYRSINDYENAMRAYQTIDRLKGLSAPAVESVSDSVQPAAPMQTESQPAQVPVQQPEETPTPAQQPDADPAPAWKGAPAWVLAPESNPSNESITDTMFWKDESSEPKSNEEDQPMNQNMFASPASPAKFSEASLLKDPFENAEKIVESRDPNVWNEKGNIHFQNKDFDHAIAAYNKAIELDRSFGWAYGNLAFTYLTMGKYAEALLLYERSTSLLETPQEKAAAWNSLGNIHRHLNEYEEARLAYQTADEIDPQNAGRCASLELARTEPNSKNAKVWTELGNLFFKSASYQEAVNAYFKAVNLDPTSGWAHSNLAMALAFQGRYKEAVPVYLKSIGLMPDDKDKAITWDRLGTVYRKLNDQTSARRAHQTAVILSKEKVSLLTRTRFSLLSNCYTQ